MHRGRGESQKSKTPIQVKREDCHFFHSAEDDDEDDDQSQKQLFRDLEIEGIDMKIKDDEDDDHKDDNDDDDYDGVFRVIK